MSFRHVKIHHGPTEYFHTFKHVPQKLNALRVRLQVLGFRVDLMPIDNIDVCIVEMCGCEVFRCNIKNLRFNMDILNDPICQRAVNATTLACERFQRAGCYLWIKEMLAESIFKNANFCTSKNYYLENVEIDVVPLGSTCCENCCHILLKGNPDESIPKKEQTKMFISHNFDDEDQ